MKDTLINSIKKYKWQIMIAILLIWLNMYLLTYPPKIIGEIIDLLYDINQNKEVIFKSILSLLGICILMLFVRTGWKYYVCYANRGMEKELKNQLFDRFLKIKLSKLQNIKNGQLMAYFVKDINEIRAFFFRLLSFGTRIIATCVIAIYTMATGVDVKLTLITLIPILVTSCLIIKIKQYVEESYKRAQNTFTEMSEYVQESTDSIRTTKAYACEESQINAFIKRNKKLRSNNNKVDLYSTLLKTCINIGFGLCYGISILYGSQLVLNGQITVGDFVAFNGYIGLFVGPISWIPSLISYFKRAQIDYQRIDAVFALETERITVENIKSDENELKGNIEIKNLTFHYPKYIEPALEDINISIKQGETLGIIGTLGAGKTTLMNLLLKLYNVERGKIFIDEKDINDISLETLRNNICYITQDNFLFSTTIKNNINLFRDEYEDKQIEESTKYAMIYDEIKQMPDSIHTVIGERGVDLSGGQKQRVVISRAFLQKSNIIIFDDTFSALDNRTEQSLLKNIKELTNNKTCIIISNRISDIKESDHIIVMESGKIVEEGNNDSLMEKQGLYYQFYKQQAKQEINQILD